MVWNRNRVFWASFLVKTFPDGKESACNAEDPALIPGLGRSPGEENGWLPTPVFLPREFHGQRSLLGYSACRSKVLVTQSYPTLCEPRTDYSLPGYSVHRILQARILEWVAIVFRKRPVNKQTSGFSNAWKTLLLLLSSAPSWLFSMSHCKLTPLQQWHVTSISFLSNYERVGKIWKKVS